MALANYDFSGPFFGATIITRNQERYPLWTDKKQLKTTVKDAKAAEIALSFLSELSVQLQLGFLPIIKAKLTPPYREGMAFLESELAEWGINTLEVQLGYSSGTGQGAVLSPVFVGQIFNTEVSLGESIEITLNAQGVAALDAASKRDTLTTTDSRHGIIQRLLIGDWDKPVKRAIDVDISAVKPGTDAYKLLVEDPIDFAQGGRTDWFAAWNLITEAKCWALFTGEAKNGRDTLKILSREDELAKKPEKKFRFYDFPQGQLGPMANVYPILSASTPTTAVYLPGACVGWIADKLDEKKRAVEKKNVTDTEVKPTRTAAQEGKAPLGHKESSSNVGVGDPANGKPPTKLAVAAVDSVAPQLEVSIASEFAREQALMGITLEIDTIGIPDLMPSMVIDVDGLSARLKGVYAVTDLTHTWSQGGSSTKFTCISNTQRIFQELLKAQGPTNAQQAKTAEQASTITATPKAQ